MTIVFSPIVLKGITVSSLTKQPQAELTQVVTSFYPKMQVESSENDHLLTAEQMKVEMTPYTSLRTFWMKVTESVTTEMILAQLLLYPDAKIVRTLSSEVMLSVEQSSAIEAGLTTELAIEASQLVRHGKTLSNGAVNPQAGQPVLHQGVSKQYRRYSFKTTGGVDLDKRLSTSQIAVPAAA